MQSIYDKYNIVYIDGCRHYVVDLKTKEYTFENTVPYCINIYGENIFDSSWKNMIEKVVNYIDRINPKTTAEMLAIKNSWGKQAVFSEEKKANFIPFKGIYLNGNHTAVHAMWTIQLLLQEYSIDLDKCKFIIRRSPAAEPKEVREYEHAQTEQGFKQYMIDKFNKSDAFIDAIIKTINLLNKKILPEITASYYDLFLIENPLYYANYSTKVLDYVKKYALYNENQMQTIEYSLEKLGKFIKFKHKENKLRSIKC